MNEVGKIGPRGSLLIAAACVWGAYCVVIWWSENGMNDMSGLAAAIVMLFLLNLGLHAAFCVPGRIGLFVLPALWASCVIPLYIASYHLIRGGFFGRNFTFTILGAFTLAPVVVLSLLTSLIYLWMSRR